MSFLYVQRTGRLYQEAVLVGIGHAGKYTGYNNPEMQNVPFTGPLPCGRYRIGPSYRHEHLGPVTMDLEPFPENGMFGRGLFRIHGNSDHPELSSDGCICQPHDTRILVSKAQQLGEDILDVVAAYTSGSLGG